MLSHTCQSETKEFGSLLCFNIQSWCVRYVFNYKSTHVFQKEKLIVCCKILDWCVCKSTEICGSK